MIIELLWCSRKPTNNPIEHWIQFSAPRNPHLLSADGDRRKHLINKTIITFTLEWLSTRSIRIATQMNHSKRLITREPYKSLIVWVNVVIIHDLGNCLYNGKNVCSRHRNPVFSKYMSACIAYLLMLTYSGDSRKAAIALVLINSNRAIRFISSGKMNKSEIWVKKINTYIHWNKWSSESAHLSPAHSTSEERQIDANSAPARTYVH